MTIGAAVRSTTSGGIRIESFVGEAAYSFAPELARLRVVRQWAGLRVMAPDGYPIYEQSETHPGAFTATCHSAVTLAAAHALELAPSILEGTLHPLAATFKASRFDPVETYEMT